MKEFLIKEPREASVRYEDGSYHIGLTQVDFNSCEVIVILSSLGRELKLHMNKLVDALECDVDLDSVPIHIIREIIGDLCSDWMRLHLWTYQAVVPQVTLSFITASCRRLPESLADVNPDSDCFCKVSRSNLFHSQQKGISRLQPGQLL